MIKNQHQDITPLTSEEVLLDSVSPFNYIAQTSHTSKYLPKTMKMYASKMFLGLELYFSTMVGLFLSLPAPVVSSTAADSPRVPGTAGRHAQRGVSDQGQTPTCLSHAVANVVVTMAHGALMYDGSGQDPDTNFGDAGQGAPRSAHHSIVNWLVKNVVGDCRVGAENENETTERMFARLGMDVHFTNDFDLLERHLDPSSAEFSSAAVLTWRTSSARLFYKTFQKAGSVMKQRKMQGMSGLSLIVTEEFARERDMGVCNRFNPSNWAEYEPGPVRVDFNPDNPQRACENWFGNSESWAAQSDCAKCAEGEWGWENCRHTCEMHCAWMHADVAPDQWNPGWGLSPQTHCKEWWVQGWGAGALPEKEKCSLCAAGTWAAEQCASTCYARCAHGKAAGHAVEVVSAVRADQFHEPEILRIRNSWGQGTWGDRGYLDITHNALRIMNGTTDAPYALVSWKPAAQHLLRQVQANGEADQVDAYTIVFDFAEALEASELLRLLKKLGAQPANGSVQYADIAISAERVLGRQGYRVGCYPVLDQWSPDWSDPENARFRDELTPRKACREWWGNAEWGAEKRSQWTVSGQKCASVCAENSWGRRACGGTCQLECGTLSGHHRNTPQNNWAPSWAQEQAGGHGMSSEDFSCESWWQSSWGANQSCEACLAVLHDDHSGDTRLKKRWGCRHCARTCHRWCGDGKRLQGLKAPSVFRILARAIPAPGA